MDSKIKKFEELIAWQKARQLTRQVYQLTSKSSFNKDFGLRDQIRRAAVSVMSNIAEGFERYRKKEFHQYLSIAKASCAEIRSQLYIARDVNYISHDEFAGIHSGAEEVARIIGGLRASLE